MCSPSPCTMHGEPDGLAPDHPAGPGVRADPAPGGREGLNPLARNTNPYGLSAFHNCRTQPGGVCDMSQEVELPAAYQVVMVTKINATLPFG